MSVNLQQSPLGGDEVLAEQIRDALKLADALGYHGVGIHLDTALVCLTGAGLPPPASID